VSKLSKLSTASVPESKAPPPCELELAGVAVTVTVCVAEPPGPVQVRLRVASAVIATATPVLLVGSLPVHWGAPLAVHAVAPVLVQLSCTDCPDATEVALAVSVTLGGAETRLSEYSP
jgi:hypothetical protein